MSDKTEAPTPKRLRDARDEGQVVRSIELNAAALMLVSVLLLRGPGAQLIQVMGGQMESYLITLPQVELTEASLGQMLIEIVMGIAPNLALILVGLLLTGVVVTVMQTGFLWSSKRVGFDFKRLNPFSGIKRVFSSHALIELLKALLKLVVIIWTAYTFLRDNYQALLILNQMDLRSAVQRFVDLAFDLAFRVGGVYLILAAADYAYQRWDLMRNLRMSKQDIKEEFKRAEGDPFLKSRIRSQQRRMARGRMMANVPKATVIVTNPTHLALAIEYHEGMQAPRLLAKGAHLVAQRIVALAREKNIPVVQNIPLARAIYKTVEVDQEITPNLYMAMAEVLAYVYRMRGIARPQPAANPMAK